MKYVLCVGVMSKGKIKITTNDTNRVSRITKQG